VLGALVAVAAVIFVARPFLRDPSPASDQLDEPDELERRRVELAEERDRALAALASVGIDELADHQFGELSGGQRQRVLLARALVQDAQLLLLDEPFSGVDEPSVGRLMALIDELAAEGRSVMIATHDVEQVREWDLVLCLNRRQVAFGPPATTLTMPVLEATYGGTIVLLEPRGEAGRAAALMPPHHHDHDHRH
jgi:ABC-type Mn2+/Zn2+ transport system ATPase subunit